MYQSHGWKSGVILRSATLRTWSPQNLPGLKWGGELTEAGINDAEAPGGWLDFHAD